MNKHAKPIGSIWRPVRDLNPSLYNYTFQGARKEAKRWKNMRQQLEEPTIDRRAMDIWLKSHNRAFAIETGQIEGLYTLNKGVTETLIAEGFEGVRGTHSATAIDDNTLKGLLTDQEAALEMMFAHVKDERPLTSSTLKEWHALLTRHQNCASGVNIFGKIIDVPLRKGEYKIHPNNPSGRDGFIFEYCPPEQVVSEMERFLDMHHGHRGLNLAPEVEAAWLHHEFVRIHPFQDGNGRIARLLMAMPYAKGGEFPPIILTDQKDSYINALEMADSGQLDFLIDYLGILAQQRSALASQRATSILAGMVHYRHGNCGISVDGDYYPPDVRSNETRSDP